MDNHSTIVKSKKPRLLLERPTATQMNRIVSAILLQQSRYGFSVDELWKAIGELEDDVIRSALDRYEIKAFERRARLEAEARELGVVLEDRN